MVKILFCFFFFVLKWPKWKSLVIWAVLEWNRDRWNLIKFSTFFLCLSRPKNAMKIDGREAIERERVSKSKRRLRFELAHLDNLMRFKSSPHILTFYLSLWSALLRRLSQHVSFFSSNWFDHKRRPDDYTKMANSKLLYFFYFRFSKRIRKM